MLTAQIRLFFMVTCLLFVWFGGSINAFRILLTIMFILQEYQGFVLAGILTTLLDKENS